MTKYFDKNKTYDIFTRKNYYKKVADGVYKIADNVAERMKLNLNNSVDLVYLLSTIQEKKIKGEIDFFYNLLK